MTAVHLPVIDETPLSIALIASHRFPIAEPFAGGLEAHVWHLARALVDRGHRVALFAAAGSDLGVEHSRLDVSTFTPSPAAQRDVSMPADEFMAAHHAYLELMMKLSTGTDFDIIHNHSLHYLPIALARTAAAPVLTTLHTPPTPWLESAIEVNADNTRFVAVSDYTARSWRHAAADIDVISNGVDLRLWPAGPGGDELVWFGRLVPEKGAHVAVQAAARAGVGLRLAGPISDRAYFEREIRPLLSDRIRYVGHLDQKELATLVGHSAATLVTPLWDEPYGLVVAESLACGTPVAGFRRGGIPEILGAGSGILTEPDDVDALAAAARRAMSLSRGVARARAESHCAEGEMVEGYVSLYRHLTSRAGVAPA
jgi:glycosyltransferase involved in cell wall biosynthesis